MSRMISRDQRSPSISTEAFRGQPERRRGAGFFPAILECYQVSLAFCKRDKQTGAWRSNCQITRKSVYFHVGQRGRLGVIRAAAASGGKDERSASAGRNKKGSVHPDL